MRERRRARSRMVQSASRGFVVRPVGVAGLERLRGRCFLGAGSVRRRSRTGGRAGFCAFCGGSVGALSWFGFMVAGGRVRTGEGYAGRGERWWYGLGRNGS